MISENLPDIPLTDWAIPGKLTINLLIVHMYGEKARFALGYNDFKKLCICLVM